MVFSKAQVEELRSVFKHFDTTGDGKINSCELGQVLQKVGYNPSKGELSSMILEVDANGSGKVEFSEFLAMMQRRSQPSMQEIADAFRAFDYDGSGYISEAELVQVLGTQGEKLSKKQIAEMMKEADKDRDGKVNYNEFLKMMN